MMPTSSAYRRQALVMFTFKTRRKLKAAKMLYNQFKLSTRRTSGQFKNPELQKLYTLTSSRHINDCLINSVSLKNPHQILTNNQFNSTVDRKFNKRAFNHTWNKFINLNEEQLPLCHILKV